MPLFSRYMPWWCNPAQHEALSRLRFGFKTTFCQKPVEKHAMWDFALLNPSERCGRQDLNLRRH